MWNKRRAGQESIAMLWRNVHLPAALFLVALTVLSTLAWIAVQSTRDEPLPTLVWAPEIPAEIVFALGLPIRDRLGSGWWWIQAAPADREKFRLLGAKLVLAMPTPVARMAGCSGDMAVDPNTPPPRI
ncbi:MAG: hypothetical protein RL397_1949 [Pseudomonadota bacterium]